MVESEKNLYRAHFKLHLRKDAEFLHRCRSLRVHPIGESSADESCTRGLGPKVILPRKRDPLKVCGGPGGIRTRDLPVPRAEYLANRTFFGL